MFALTDLSSSTVPATTLSSSPGLACLAPFLSLKASGQRATDPSLFICEAPENLRVLLETDDITINCLVCTPKLWTETFYDLAVERMRRGGRSLPQSPPHSKKHKTEGNTSVATGTDKCTSFPFPVILLTTASIATLAGWANSRGCLAQGVIPARTVADLYSLLNRSVSPRLPHRILAVDKISDTSNLGSLIRSAAAFGITAIVLSGDSCDAWYRKSVRTSMGHVFRVPIYRTADLANFLIKLRDDCNVCSYAAMLDDTSVDVTSVRVARDYCIVVGNEGDGIREEVKSKCTSAVKIMMMEGVDSLNVTIAASIIMHDFKARAAED